MCGAHAASSDHARKHQDGPAESNHDRQGVGEQRHQRHGDDDQRSVRLRAPPGLTAVVRGVSYDLDGFGGDHATVEHRRQAGQQGGNTLLGVDPLQHQRQIGGQVDD